MSTHVASPQAAHVAAWPDYEWATWLPSALADAGVPYLLEPGWETNGRPRSVGPFAPRGMLWHHDASAAGPTPSEAEFIGRTGRPAEGIPAPLAHAWVCAGCKGAHAVGTWHLLAAGRANHGGLGEGWGVIRADQANADALGVETDHTTGEAWLPALLASLERGTAAIFKRAGWDPAEALAGHKEYAPGRKTDPDGLDMAHERATVARIIAELHHPANADHAAPRPRTPRFPGRPAFVLGQGHGGVKRLQRWLHETGDLSGTHAVTGVFDVKTRAAVKRFQKRTPALKASADGMPGPVTWRLLCTAARHARATANA